MWKKGLCKCDRVKDLEMEITLYHLDQPQMQSQVSLERQREAEGDMIQIHRGGDSVNVEAEIRVIQARNASNVLFSRRSWRGKQQILLSMGSMALLISWFGLTETNFRLLASRTLGEYISVALNHQVYGNYNLLLWSQETNTMPLCCYPSLSLVSSPSPSIWYFREEFPKPS